MLRSISLLTLDPSQRVPAAGHADIHPGSYHLLILATLAAFVAAATHVSAQTDQASASSQETNSQAQICDGLNHGGANALSLTIRKTGTSTEGNDEAEQQTASQVSSESKSGDARLPELKNSGSEKQDQVLLCRKKKTGTEAETANPGDPPQPPAQVSEVHGSAAGPAVSYSDGELTVNPHNAPMKDVIEAIRVHTGISVDFPSESMNDRVFDQVGPAPLRDALTKLLYGSGYNYVIQTSPENPETVTRLFLSTQSHVAATEPRPAPPPVVEQAEAYGATPSTDAPAVPVQPIQNPTAIGIPVGFNIKEAAAASGKTTGQILDELQKQQQQILDSQAPQPQ